MSKFTRKGLHRLECTASACDGFAYATIASMERALERHGRILVCACGEDMRPERIDVVMALGLDDEQVNAEMQATLAVKESSQRRSLGGTNQTELRRMRGTLNDMWAKTLDDIRAEQAENARRRRGRVRQPVELIPF